MNGTESLLLIIVGILSIRFSFYLGEEEVPHGWESEMFLVVAIYAWVAFIAGNVTFFYWLFTK